jgi:predicted RNase H-like HicB family nuclease
MTHYVGVLDSSCHVWGVRIPDVHGCIGGSATPEAAISNAASALRDVMAHKQSGGCASPSAGIIASGEITEGESAVMIPLLRDAGRTVRAKRT